MKERRVGISLLAALAALVLAGGLIWRYVKQPPRELRKQAALVYMALEYYAAETGGYPDRIEAIVGPNQFMHNWPANPYGGGRLMPLATDAEPVAGGFVYATAGRTGPSELSAAEAAAPGFILPTYPETYELIFYGRRTHRLASKTESKDSRGVCNTKLSKAYGTTPWSDDHDLSWIDLTPLYGAHEQIHWDQVAFVLVPSNNYVERPDYPY